jgi:hypothetical protein
MCANSNNAKTTAFDRIFFEATGAFKQIGSGSIGGKAAGLSRARRILRDEPYPDLQSSLRIEVPSVAVIATDVFDAFMHRNGLLRHDLTEMTDERIAHRFLKSDFPVEFVGDLRSLVESTAGNPLAIRSSSLLEDTLEHPFAGVYRTKMIPNNHPDPSIRFQRLIEAVKFVYASTFFGDAARYTETLGDIGADEKMAVVIQEVVGLKHGERFYPHLSGVCRSYNFYRSGSALPEEGVVNMALGLGKTIVDGGVSWTYSPAHPAARPPFATSADALKNTQLQFWAVNVGAMPPYNPAQETEYLLECSLTDAEYDNTLLHLASTYDPTRDRIVPGVGSDGARVLDFAPVLQLELWPVNRAISKLLQLFESETYGAVEVEFAITFPSRTDQQARFAVLQVRPMFVSRDRVDLPESLREAPGLVAYSDRVMGNGRDRSLTHIVYVKPDVFERHLTPRIAAELESLNRTLRALNTPYVLIGFGRWGSSDPWLGIPVTWGQISGAAVIVESTLPDFDVEPSQGAHFFHNIAAFQVGYFSVHHETDPEIAWDWLGRQRVVTETETLRHVEVDRPLSVVMDGRSGRGAILYDEVEHSDSP